MVQGHLQRFSGSVGSVNSEGGIDGSDSEVDDKFPDSIAITASHIQLQQTSSRESSPGAPGAQYAPFRATSATDLPDAPRPVELQLSNRNSNGITFNKRTIRRDNGPLTVAAALDAVARARPPSTGSPITSLTLLNLSTPVPPPTDPTIQQLSSRLTSLRLHDTSHRKAAEEGAVNLLLQPTAPRMPPTSHPSQPPATTTRAPGAATTSTSTSTSSCCSASVPAVQTYATTNDIRSRGQAMVQLALAMPRLSSLSLTSATFPAEDVRQLASLAHLEELSLYGSLECEGGGRQAVSVQRALLASLPRLRTLRLPMSLQAPRRYGAGGEPLLYDSDDEDESYAGRGGGAGGGGDELCWDSPMGPPAPAGGAKGPSPTPAGVGSWAGVISPVAPAAAVTAASGGGSIGAAGGGGGRSSWTLPPHISPTGLLRASVGALLPPLPTGTSAPAATAAIRATVSAGPPALPPAPLLSPLPPMPALPSLSSLALSSNGGDTRTTLATSRSGTTTSSFSSLGGLTHTTSRLSSGLLLSPAAPQPHPRASNTTSTLPPAPHRSISPAAAAAAGSLPRPSPTLPRPSPTLPRPSPTLPPWDAVASALASATAPLPPSATTTSSSTTTRPSATIPAPPALRSAPPPRAPLPPHALLPAAPALPPMPPAQPPRRSSAPSALAAAAAVAAAPTLHTLPPPPPPPMPNRRAWSTSQLLPGPQTQQPTNTTNPNRPGWRTGSCSAPRCSFTFPPDLQEVALPICRMNAPLFRALCDAYSPPAPAVHDASVMPRAVSVPVIGAVPGLDAGQGRTGTRNGNGCDAEGDGGAWRSMGAGGVQTRVVGGGGIDSGGGGGGLRSLHLPAAAGWTSWEGTFVKVGCVG